MTIEKFKALKSKELDSLVPFRKVAYEKGDALKIVVSGKHHDLLAFYEKQWHYITTYKEENEHAN
jgi:hypothetical protein